jgi:hypothetical protein
MHLADHYELFSGHAFEQLALRPSHAWESAWPPFAPFLNFESYVGEHETLGLTASIIGSPRDCLSPILYFPGHRAGEMRLSAVDPPAT